MRDLVTAALSGEYFCVAIEEIELSRHWTKNKLNRLRDASQHFGMDKLFVDVPQARQRSLLQAMIFRRILFPGAKLAIAEAAPQHLFGRCLRALPTSGTSFDEDDLSQAIGCARWWFRSESKAASQLNPSSRPGTL